tara:strand:- start:1639 stop:1902 length:264 start_codon:yes stop_codon:yes gene_type:complete
MSDQTTHRAVLISSMDLALMEAERKRLRKERDAATNALHGMRRRLDRLTRTLANTREVLESTDEWQQGLLEDHWDAVREDELEQDDD